MKKKKSSAQKKRGLSTSRGLNALLHKAGVVSSVQPAASRQPLAENTQTVTAAVIDVQAVAQPTGSDVSDVVADITDATDTANVADIGVSEPLDQVAQSSEAIQVSNQASSQASAQAPDATDLVHDVHAPGADEQAADDGQSAAQASETATIHIELDDYQKEQIAQFWQMGLSQTP